jgi:hypothetical protein
MNSPNKIKAVVIAAGVMTFLSVTPLVSMINMLCCAGVLLGAAAGVYVYNKDVQNFGKTLELKDGAMIGILSGIITAIIYTGFFLAIQLFSEGNMFTEMSSDLEKFGFPVSPEYYQVMDHFNDETREYGFSPTLTGVTLFLNLVIYPLFGAIGGLLTANILRKKNQAPQL